MTLRSAHFAATVSLAFLAASAFADVLSPTKLVSQTPAGQPGNNFSLDPNLSHDGRFVTFWSAASDLVSSDSNGTYDVFVRDTLAGTTELISQSPSGVPGDGPSIQPSLSADGRYVCFNSATSNLVSPPVIAYFEMYVRDRVTGITEMVSVNDAGGQANNTTEYGAISADGRYATFASYADNLVMGHPSNGHRDIYRRDRVTDTTILVSKGPGGVLADTSSYESAVSSNGRFVAFRSQASNLVAGGTTFGRQNVFVYDAISDTVSLLSAAAGGVEANGDSYDVALSANGRYVAFSTAATNLLPVPLSGSTLVVLRDLTSGAIENINLDTTGHAIQSSASQPTLSADGRFVAFHSGAILLNASGQLFVRDRQLGKTIAACAKDDGDGSSAGPAYNAKISGDGSTVVIPSGGVLVNGVPPSQQIYVRGIGGPLTYCVAKGNSAGCQPAIGFAGEARVSNGFALNVTCSSALNNKVGILIHGVSGALSAPFFGGTLCVSPPLARSMPVLSGGNAPPAYDCSGVWSLNLGTVLASSPIGPAVGAGSVLYLQWWGRDPGFPAPVGVQLSNAMQVVVGP